MDLNKKEKKLYEEEKQWCCVLKFSGEEDQKHTITAENSDDADEQCTNLKEGYGADSAALFYGKCSEEEDDDR